MTSKLDTLNALIYGLPDVQIKRLQGIQNCAARTITKSKKCDYITPVLKKLHWLPIRERIRFKIVLLTYKALNGLAPQYILDLLKYKDVTYSTRSADQQLLHIPFTRNVTFADRSFSVAAPTEWNKIPLKIRLISNLDTFKTQLKTYLFSKCYK